VREAAAFHREVLERVASLPGVRTAAAVTAMPFTGRWDSRPFRIEGRTDDPARNVAAVQAVSSGYFRTVHVGLRAGRLFSGRDGRDGSQVAIVSRQVVRRWFPAADPIGRRIRIGHDPRWTQIVGVVDDIRQSTTNLEPASTIYVPYEQALVRSMDFGLRVDGDPMRLAAAVRSVVRTLDPEQPVQNLNTLAAVIHQQNFVYVYMAVLMGIFGSLALLLASLGVYGVMAHMVAGETREIGIRMALGAGRGRVMRAVFLRGMGTSVLGLAAGLLPAAALAHGMRAMLWGTGGMSLSSMLAIPLVLLGAVVLAIYVPARRATRIDPMAAVRVE
jgi:putative ABC transport system permease protein